MTRPTPGLSFDAISQDYDAARPDYPPALFADLFAAAPRGQKAEIRILEIGCGTGLATAPLAASPEARLTAIDPGANMLAQARRRVGEDGDVRFLQTTFERLDLRAQAEFDLICSGQAWHWVDPAIGYPKAARMLTRGGILALFGNVPGAPPPHLAGPLAEVFRAALGERAWSLAHAGYGPGGFIARDLVGCGLFQDLRHFSYRREAHYSAQAWAAFVASHSTVQGLAPADRSRLLDGLIAVVEAGGGEIQIGMETHAWVGRRTQV